MIKLWELNVTQNPKKLPFYHLVIVHGKFSAAITCQNIITSCEQTTYMNGFNTWLNLFPHQLYQISNEWNGDVFYSPTSQIFIWKFFQLGGNLSQSHPTLFVRSILRNKDKI